MTRFSFLLLQPLTAFAHEDDIRRTLELIKGCDYDGVEFNLTLGSMDHMPRLESWLAESGLAAPSFCTGEAYAKGLCLSSTSERARRGAVQRLVEYLDAAERFQAVLVVGLMQGLRSDEPDPEVANRRIVEGLREVGAAAEARGVEFVIEPVNHLQVGFNNTVAEVRELIRSIGSPAIRPMVDTVHMNIEERSLTQPIYDCGPELRHVHLCETNGGLFGTGHLPFHQVLGALNDIDYGHYASVKVYRRASVEEAVPSSIDVLRRAEQRALEESG